jgi:translation initiation factor IF-2
VKIVIAINKIDLASANPDRVKKQLQERGLTPEDWGGDTICVPVSATKGTGINELLDLMLLEAEMLELKSSETVDARCSVIEAQVEQGRGPTVTVIVRMGTLRLGDVFICGNYWGKVKQLIFLSHANYKKSTYIAYANTFNILKIELSLFVSILVFVGDANGKCFLMKNSFNISNKK